MFHLSLTLNYVHEFEELRSKIMDDNESFVRVTIFGQDYTVKAPADSTYIKSIAKYVDEKMREVQQGLSDPQSTTRISMLAAMNIADEYFSSRNDKDKFTSEIEGKVHSIIEVIDDELK